MNWWGWGKGRQFYFLFRDFDLSILIYCQTEAGFNLWTDSGTFYVGMGTQHSLNKFK